MEHNEIRREWQEKLRELVADSATEPQTIERFHGSKLWKVFQALFDLVKQIPRSEAVFELSTTRWFAWAFNTTDANPDDIVWGLNESDAALAVERIKAILESE